MKLVLQRNDKSISDIDLIIFDKDGTIIDIHHYWISMIKLRAHKLVDTYFKNVSEVIQQNHFTAICEVMGVDFEVNKLKPDGPVGIKPRTFIVTTVADYLNGQFVNCDETQVEAIFKEIDQATQQDLTPLLKLLPGIVDFLIAAKKKNLKLAIATTDITIRAEQAMQALNVAHLFDCIWGADKVTKTKPAPDLALSILNQLSVAADKAVIIGDHRVDLETGHSANLKASIGVCTGLATESELLKYSEFVIETFKEIKICD